MISLKLQGGLGNQLFQYCSGRILAENSEMFFICPKIKGFERTKILHKGKFRLGPVQKITGHYLPKLVSQRTVLEGYFQRIELLDTHKDKVKKWLELEQINPPYKSDKDDMTLSIRRGSNGWPIEFCPTIEHYMRLLEEFEFRNLWITTDSPSDKYFSPLLKKIPAARILDLNTLEQFKFIQESSRIIVAPSTFSVLAAWSSEASNIYWPKIDALDFSQTEHNWFSKSDTRNEYLHLS